jgi:hypothetical protein
MRTVRRQGGQGWGQGDDRVPRSRRRSLLHDCLQDLPRASTPPLLLLRPAWVTSLPAHTPPPSPPCSRSPPLPASHQTHLDKEPLRPSPSPQFHTLLLQSQEVHWQMEILRQQHQASQRQQTSQPQQTSEALLHFLASLLPIPRRRMRAILSLPQHQPMEPQDYSLPLPLPRGLKESFPTAELMMVVLVRVDCTGSFEEPVGQSCSHTHLPHFHSLLGRLVAFDFVVF